MGLARGGVLAPAPLVRYLPLGYLLFLRPTATAHSPPLSSFSQTLETRVIYYLGSCAVLIVIAGDPKVSTIMSDRLFEGIGAPITVARDDDLPSIDPTLDSCCQREVRNKICNASLLKQKMMCSALTFSTRDRLNPTVNETP